MSNASKGGFHIGNIGGNLSQQAGGDIVGGDKVTTTTTMIPGFKQEEDKQQFLQEIEKLRAALRELQANMQASAALSQDDKDEIVAAIMQRVNDLKKAGKEADSLPVAQEAPPDKRKSIEDYLQTTSTLLDKAKELGEKAADYATKLAPYIEKALPLLLSARRLFGLP